MENLGILFVCLLLGIIFQHIKSFPHHAHVTLNNIVIYVSLPAITLLHIPEMPFSRMLWMPVSAAWIVFILAVVFFIVLQRFLYLDKPTLGCLILTCGLFNSSFIGFPVIKSLYGEEGLQIAILVDQPGSFLVLSTLGIATAAWFSSGKPRLRPIVLKIISFPPLWGFTAAIILRILQWSLPDAAIRVLKSLADIMAPLALISVGMQLKWPRKIVCWKEIAAGLLYKLLIAPAAIYFLFISLFGVNILSARVSVMEAAMAPMITGALLATQYKLNPELASILVTIGIPLSFLTLTLWYMFLH